MSSAEEAFRRLTIGDPDYVAELAGRQSSGNGAARLDSRTEALIRVGVLIAVDAPSSSYRAAVSQAQVCGAQLDELLAVLIAVAGEVGSARVVAAAPRIALAAGYDVEAALE